MHEIAYGIDLVELGIRNFLGVDVAKRFAARKECDPGMCLKDGWVMPPYSSIVRGISSFSESLQAKFCTSPHVRCVMPPSKNDAEVVGYKTCGLLSCLIQVLTSAANEGPALEQLRLVLNMAEQRMDTLVLPKMLATPDTEVAADACGTGLLELLPPPIALQVQVQVQRKNSEYHGEGSVDVCSCFAELLLAKSQTSRNAEAVSVVR
eukprot:gb/GFBE01077504.1/.p1 GENE.gb/GFBE01077504.1/~~gb/GFBE01077504.1/.p1  ORF type:complete len:207 (+),score=44.05 gb/GFBE01077504.1/:1-621(+)